MPEGADDYDTVPSADVLQANAPPVRPPVVPVEVEGVVRVDEMPTENVYRRIVLRAGAAAEKVLSEDPRRKRAVMWILPVAAGCDCVVIGNMGQAQSFTGALLTTPNATTRYEFSDRKELYARAGDIQISDSAFAGVIAATADCVLSIVIEQWSR